MPWYCGNCRRWNHRDFHCCSSCGRPPKGKLCRSCKKPVPKEAGFCVHCGSRRLSDPGMAMLPLRHSTRIGILVLAVLAISLIVRLLMPVFAMIWHWILHVLCYLAIYLLLFWLITGLLPGDLGKRIRSFAWRSLLVVIHFVAKLFS